MVTGIAFGIGTDVWEVAQRIQYCRDKQFSTICLGVLYVMQGSRYNTFSLNLGAAFQTNEAKPNYGNASEPSKAERLLISDKYASNRWENLSIT